MERVCERCGGDDDDLVLVNVAQDDGAPTPELWCAGCRTDEREALVPEDD